MKQTWQKPQLIVLTRSKTQEAVLSGCKTFLDAEGSPMPIDNQCDVVEGCHGCHDIVDS